MNAVFCLSSLCIALYFIYPLSAFYPIKIQYFNPMIYTHVYACMFVICIIKTTYFFGKTFSIFRFIRLPAQHQHNAGDQLACFYG